MQTFLPYKRFDHSARALDDKRLDKQRVEAMQIMSALMKLRFHTNTANIPWANHPATKMWFGYEHALLNYQEAICGEWVRRGNRDGMLDKTADLILSQPGFQMIGDPPWLGKKLLHSSHRANLLREAPEWYDRFNWPEEPAEDFWWPTENGF